MQRTIERIRCRINRTHRIMVASVLVFGLLLSLFTILISSNVTVNAAGSPDAMQAAEAGVALTATGRARLTNQQAPLAGAAPSLSFDISVTADGQTHLSTHVNGDTVADALAACGVVPGEQDFVSHALDEPLLRNMDIAVTRVSYQEVSGRYEVSEENVAAYVATLPEGTEFTYSKSRIYNVSYRHRTEDGQIAQSEVLALEAVYHPYDEPNAAFEAGVAASSIDGFLGIELDENGIPTSYSRKMEGAVATAYSASAGRGAGGQGLYCGTVAVNPNVIPYGTRLYITAADGSFVYGYAIASDCGTAMMEGYVDVDLYFESNAECRRFGKRHLDIYILD